MLANGAIQFRMVTIQPAMRTHLEEVRGENDLSNEPWYSGAPWCLRAVLHGRPRGKCDALTRKDGNLLTTAHPK